MLQEFNLSGKQEVHNITVENMGSENNILIKNFSLLGKSTDIKIEGRWDKGFKIIISVDCGHYTNNIILHGYDNQIRMSGEHHDYEDSDYFDYGFNKETNKLEIVKGIYDCFNKDKYIPVKIKLK